MTVTVTDDQYTSCKKCLLEIGLNGCRKLGARCAGMPASTLQDEARGESGGDRVGVSAQGIADAGERINDIMTHLAAPPFNKKLRGM